MSLGRRGIQHKFLLILFCFWGALVLDSRESVAHGPVAHAGSYNARIDPAIAALLLMNSNALGGIQSGTCSNAGRDCKYGASAAAFDHAAQTYMRTITQLEKEMSTLKADHDLYNKIGDSMDWNSGGEQLYNNWDRYNNIENSLPLLRAELAQSVALKNQALAGVGLLTGNCSSGNCGGGSGGSDFMPMLMGAALGAGITAAASGNGGGHDDSGGSSHSSDSHSHGSSSSGPQDILDLSNPAIVAAWMVHMGLAPVGATNPIPGLPAGIPVQWTGSGVISGDIHLTGTVGSGPASAGASPTSSLLPEVHVGH